MICLLLFYLPELKKKNLALLEKRREIDEFGETPSVAWLGGTRV